MSKQQLDSTVFTFKPSLSTASIKIAENLTSDFMTRQQQHLENQKKYAEKTEIINKKVNPQTQKNSGLTSKDFIVDSEYVTKRSENIISPVESVERSDAIIEEEEKEEEDNLREDLLEESLDQITDNMPPVSSVTIDRMKTTNSANLQRLLEGPYAVSQQEVLIKNRLGQPGIYPRPVMGDLSDKDKENEVPGSFSRSKTMPSIAKPKFGRKLSMVADGDRLRNAKDIVEKAIKYRKVFTIQGGYASIRQSLRKRGWVEKFYKTTAPAKRPSRPKRRKQNSDSDDDEEDNGDNDDNDDDDDDDGTDDDNDEPKIPPWEEDDGIYGIMSRMVRNVNPLFFWVLKRDVIDYRFLLKDQMVNHYCKAGSFTTKVGLCVNLRNVRFFDNADQDSFCPRCYRLSHDEDKEAFIEDYRLSACMNILKIVQALTVNPTSSERATSSSNSAVVHVDSEKKTCETVSSSSAKESGIQGGKNPTTVESKLTEFSKEPIPTKPSCKDPKCLELSKEDIKCEHLKADELKQAEEEKKKMEEQKLEESKKTVQLNLSPRGRATPINNKSSPRNKKKKKAVVVPILALEQAIQQCENFLKFKDHEDIDVTEEFGTLGESQWNQLIQWYYNLAHDEGVLSPIPQHLIEKVDSLINRLKTKCPQFELDGVKNVWIVKPGAKSRGRGIVCYDKLEDMLKLVSSNVVRKDSKYVVQKYIERPLLIYNTKFDIRQWFLVTDWNPLTIWFYQDSYLRFCSQEYTLDDFDESIHLSNNAIQKYYKNGPRSSSLPSDNMWTHEQFKDYLSEKGESKLWDNMIYPGMKKAIQCALLTTQDLIEYRKSSFELYGADFMLTEDYRPWLIEINSSPSMEASTTVTAKMCSSVLDDTIKVVIDRRYDRNCDIGRFELAYKQPVVTVPPYIGINLQVEGQAIRKPFGFKKPEPPPPLELISPQSSRQTLPEIKSSSSNSYLSNSESKSKENSSPASNSKTVSKKSPAHGATYRQKENGSKSPSKTGTTSVEPVLSDNKLQTSISDTGIGHYNQTDITPAKVIKSGGAIPRQPEPPTKPKVCVQTPYVSIGSRRIISKTSVSNSYTFPGSLHEKPLRPANIAVKNVETTDIRSIKAQKGNLDPPSLFPVSKIRRKNKKVKAKQLMKMPRTNATIRFPKVTYAGPNLSLETPGGGGLPRLKMFNLTKSRENIFRPAIKLGEVGGSWKIGMWINPYHYL